MVAAWIDSEFASLDLGDERRERRARMIVDQFTRIAESTPEACQDKAALEATYRFAKNPAVRPEAILQAPHQAAITRSAEHDCVVLVQDTSVIDLTKPNRQVRGAGPLESEDKRGLFLHPLYGLTEQGLPLGMFDQVIWTREQIRTDLDKPEKQRLRKQTCFEEKESSRWFEMFQSGEQIALANPGTHYVNVADSESDIHEIYTQTSELPANYDFVIRSCQNRALATGAESIDQTLADAEIRFEGEVTVSERKSLIVGETRPRRKSRSARSANVKVRATSVTLRGPARPGGKLADATVNVVEIVETDPPAGEEPIRWVLLTSLPISSVAEIQRVIRIYCLRWQIELYFKTLKSGLGIEKLKYEELDRYVTALSLLMIVAWRVEYLKGAARLDPNASCETYFEDHEWMPACMVLNQSHERPAEAPTISQFMLIVARLGGYIDKKGQGPPGSTTIWRGLRRMEAFSEVFQILGTPNHQTKDV